MKRYLWILLAVMALVAGCHKAPLPPDPEDPDNPEVPVIPEPPYTVEESSFSTQRDGLRIGGVLFSPVELKGRKPAVILCHGLDGSWLDTEPYGRAAARLGCVSFCFDFCGGHDGESKSEGERKDHSVLTEIQDVAAVYNAMKAREDVDPNRIFLMGGSQGGLVSAMVYYADKLYLLLELSNEALAQSKIRFHLYFNSNFDSDGGYSDKWGDLDIDYATEGKIAEGGSFVEYSSKLYKTKPGTVWGTEDSGYSPVFKSAGDGILYELSMDYTDFPGGLADVFSLGLDIADDGYNCIGFLPNKGANPEKAVIKKAGYTKVGGITIDGDMKDWAAIEGLSDPESYLQAFKVTYDDDYIYFYNKRNWNNALWGVEAGYYYFCLDLDNNASTTLEGGANGNEIPGLDAWMFVYPFLGSAEAPVFGKASLSGDGYPENCFNNLICEGRFNEAKTYIETEMRVPRADMGVNKGVIKCFSWGNKSASNLKSTPLTITIEK